MKKKRVGRILLWSLLMVLALATPSFADVGIPMIIFEFPFMIVLLIPVIVIEAIVFKKELGIGYKKAGVLSSVANAVTTLMGYPMIWLGRTFLSMMLLGILIPLFQFFVEQGKDVSVIMDGLMVLTGGGWLSPDAGEWVIAGAWFVGMLIAFVVSVFAEGLMLYLFMKEKRENPKLIWRAALRANICSYIFLVICWTVGICTEQLGMPFAMVLAFFKLIG